MSIVENGNAKRWILIFHGKGKKLSMINLKIDIFDATTIKRQIHE